MIFWISGASSGLGYYTALAAARAGHTVVAGARSFSEGEKDGMFTCPLDVTHEESIAHFVEYASRTAGDADVLIHCAGILVLGSTEDTSIEEYTRVMDTDFLGMVRLNQAVLPRMRTRRQGKIIMFSSINGLLGIPFQSAYTAAKHAVEGYAECLEMETHAFGIQVCLIEPGDHRSGSQRCRLHASVSDASPYQQMAVKGTKKIHHDEENGSDPAKLGQKVIRIAGRKRLPMRKRIASPDQHLAVVLHDILPGWMNSLILRSYYLGNSR